MNKNLLTRAEIIIRDEGTIDRKATTELPPRNEVTEAVRKAVAGLWQDLDDQSDPDDHDQTQNMQGLIDRLFVGEGAESPERFAENGAKLAGMINEIENAEIKEQVSIEFAECLYHKRAHKLIDCYLIPKSTEAKNDETFEANVKLILFPLSHLSSLKAHDTAIIAMAKALGSDEKYNKLSRETKKALRDARDLDKPIARKKVKKIRQDKDHHEPENREYIGLQEYLFSMIDYPEVAENGNGYFTEAQLEQFYVGGLYRRFKANMEAKINKVSKGADRKMKRVGSSKQTDKQESNNQFLNKELVKAVVALALEPQTNYSDNSNDAVGFPIGLHELIIFTRHFIEKTNLIENDQKTKLLEDLDQRITQVYRDRMTNKIKGDPNNRIVAERYIDDFLQFVFDHRDPSCKIKAVIEMLDDGVSLGERFENVFKEEVEKFLNGNNGIQLLRAIQEPIQHIGLVMERGQGQVRCLGFRFMKLYVDITGMWDEETMKLNVEQFVNELFDLMKKQYANDTRTKSILRPYLEF